MYACVYVCYITLVKNREVEFTEQFVLAIAFGKYLSLWGSYHLKKLAQAGGLTINSVYFPTTPSIYCPNQSDE